LKDCSGCVDTLRFPMSEIRAVLAELGEVNSPLDLDRRRAARYPYMAGEPLVFQLEGSSTKFVVRSRDLSAHGIGFLHGSFLYQGQGCTIALRTIDGEEVLVTGKIVHCRCVRGRIHVVGMLFDNPVEIENFIYLDEDGLGPTKPIAEGSSAGHYPAGEVADLARQLEELALSRAPRDDLHRIAKSLLVLLRGKPNQPS